MGIRNFTLLQTPLIGISCFLIQISKWLPYFNRIRNSYLMANSSPPGQNGHNFTDNIFRCISLNEKFGILIKIALNFVLKGQINNYSLSKPMLTQFTDAYMRHQNLFEITYNQNWYPLRVYYGALFNSNHWLGWESPACVTLWRQLQTRFWDASPRASVQKQQAMVFSFFTVFSLTIVDFTSMTPWMNKLSSVHIT